MSKLITSDDQLREIIPNIQIAVEGQTPWIFRLQSFLLQAEAYLERFFSRLDIISADESLLEIASRLVAWKAWSLAMPSLDLVSTPNGFAVVSNQTLAPASQPRVIAARENARDVVDATASELILALSGNADWLASRHAAKFLTLFPFAYNIGDFFLETRPMSFYLKNCHNILQSETILAVETISNAGMEYLRYMARELAIESQDSKTFSKEDLVILDAARKAVAMEIMDPIDHVALRRQKGNIIKLLDQAVDSEVASRWKDSVIFHALKSKPFANEKNSGGFFF